MATGDIRDSQITASSSYSVWTQPFAGRLWNKRSAETSVIFSTTCSVHDFLGLILRVSRYFLCFKKRKKNKAEKLHISCFVEFTNTSQDKKLKVLNSSPRSSFIHERTE